MSTFIAIIRKEGNLYTAQCPEVGTTSQGQTIEEALANLKEATYLGELPRTRAFVTTFEIEVQDPESERLKMVEDTAWSIFNRLVSEKQQLTERESAIAKELGQALTPTTQQRREGLREITHIAEDEGAYD